MSGRGVWGWHYYWPVPWWAWPWVALFVFLVGGNIGAVLGAW